MPPTATRSGKIKANEKHKNTSFFVKPERVRINIPTCDSPTNPWFY